MERADADFIVEACNAHDALKAENKALADALEKIAAWMERQAKQNDNEAATWDTRFPGLTAANRADAKNLRAMAKDARAALAKVGR